MAEFCLYPDLVRPNICLTVSSIFFVFLRKFLNALFLQRPLKIQISGLFCLLSSSSSLLFLSHGYTLMVTTKMDVFNQHRSLSEHFLHFCQVFKTVWFWVEGKQTVNMTKSTRKAALATSPQCPLPSTLGCLFFLFLFFVQGGNLLI